MKCRHQKPVLADPAPCRTHTLYRRVSAEMAENGAHDTFAERVQARNKLLVLSRYVSAVGADSTETPAGSPPAFLARSTSFKAGSFRAGSFRAGSFTAGSAESPRKRRMSLEMDPSRPSSTRHGNPETADDDAAGSGASASALDTKQITQMTKYFDALCLTYRRGLDDIHGRQSYDLESYEIAQTIAHFKALPAPQKKGKEMDAGTKAFVRQANEKAENARGQRNFPLSFKHTVDALLGRDVVGPKKRASRWSKLRVSRKFTAVVGQARGNRLKAESPQLRRENTRAEIEHLKSIARTKGKTLAR